MPLFADGEAVLHGIQEILGRKWQPILVYQLLEDGPMRFSALKRDVDDISSLDDLSKAEPDDAPSDTMLTEESVQEMEEFIVEHLEHSQISNSETRDLMELWPDEQFFATSFLILAVSSESDSVKDFRVE